MCGPGLEIVDVTEQAERDELKSKIRKIVREGHECVKIQVPWEGMHDTAVNEIMDLFDEEIQKHTSLEE